MKKILVLSLVAASLAFGAGGYNGQSAITPGKSGGYVGSAAYQNISVKEALSARDDTMVSLKGKIVKQIKHDKYEFSDGTGSIIVEIDDDVWRGLFVGSEDLVEIKGEVDNDMLERNEIDVKYISKVK
ncbi:YgiW/YdeI family stress tolerance OB fold protein [Campylobacter hyointestinalis]|uniref:NirD/YgiW/YdeI family stress tolerance protein n=1 Tax=Campylobacter hyointestinalis subsp. hyointestinalis TaxID=91352 RepID=A0A855N8T8_CAMHY|nr:NirD/YgiW/YdeI family stress tolerance protein [Campylobacter hyointestinalis]ANE32701.1 bacterial OB fold (BOF) protein [Campylobacter hyointestinalis subsp. hyointestinalis LMG 9260]KEA44969.1 hypothetical protein CR67_00725 [Campylobacter hyointestinalis subsp. hyointestinalis]MDL2346707.1 NirD/YgiW/YdeI family stress tolerance protein [Campylobacter hyointestinalis]MDL2348682.1 NirD/YgiW/YdeI family stress tolerance protein [Campylobacter hyointestinalis]MDL2350193.1 NirD/YgiW/YdeI fami